MIIELELQAMIKRIEEKLPHLSDDIKLQAVDNINVLNMALKEIRGVYRELKESMEITAQSELDNLRLMQENIALVAINTELENQIDQLKLNIK